VTAVGFSVCQATEDPYLQHVTVAEGAAAAAVAAAAAAAVRGSNSGVAPVAAPWQSSTARHPFSQVDSANADLLLCDDRRPRHRWREGEGNGATTGLCSFVVPDLLMTGQRRAVAPFFLFPSPADNCYYLAEVPC
jgi:hypothetical protein